MAYSFRILCSFVVLLALGFQAQANDSWPGFLGPSGNPAIADQVPVTFSVSEDGQPGENVAWRVPLEGRSVSGPIVVDGKVITTSSSGMEERWMEVIAVDEQTGEVVWRRGSKCTGRPYCHPTSANAAPTPCTDGERVYAFFSSNDVVCYDLDGNLQWFRSLTASHPNAGNDIGMSASPVIVDGVLVCSVECQADSFTTGLDAESGETLWEIARTSGSNWSSPRVASDSTGSKAVILQGPNTLTAIDANSGSSLWELDCRCSSSATLLAYKDRLYVPAGGVKTFSLDKATTAPSPGWESNRISPGYASFIAGDFGLLGLNRSILVCFDAQGERNWNVRLEDAGQFYATPVMVGNHIYCFAMDGKCFVVEATADSAEVVAENELRSQVLGTPAAANNALYVRSTDALWKIATSN